MKERDDGQKTDKTKIIGVREKLIEVLKPYFDVGDKIVDEILGEIQKIVSPIRTKISESRSEFILKGDKILKGRTYALFTIQIRHFDSLILYLGDVLGEEISEIVFKELQKFAGENDAIGIISDRRFCLLKEISEREDINEICKSIIKIISTRRKIDSREIKITLNIGASIFPEHGSNIAELMKASESALEKSVKLGINSYAMFEYEVREEIERKQKLLQDIFKGISEEKIYFVLQPIFTVKEKEIKMLEILMRWEGKYLDPNEVICASEEVGAIEEIMDYTFKKISEISKIDKIISVNISPRHISQDAILDIIIHDIEKYGIEPGKMCFEITEKASSEEMNYAVKNIKKLKKMGFWIALDDFGSPNTILSHAYETPTDIIKVDSSIIRSVSKDNFRRVILRGITYIAKELGKTTIAEGVEKEEELEEVVKAGVDMLQGFLLSTPISFEEAIKLIKT